MNDRNLFDYYQTNELLFSEHNWNPEYTDSLVPYEKDLYIKMLSNRIKIQNQKEAENQL